MWEEGGLLDLLHVCPGEVPCYKRTCWTRKRANVEWCKQNRKLKLNRIKELETPSKTVPKTATQDVLKTAPKIDPKDSAKAALNTDPKT